MNVDLLEVIRKTVPVTQYISSLEDPFREKFVTRKQTYQLKRETINELAKFANKYMIIAFSAGWCKDCATNIPVLALISEETGLEARIFGGLKKDPLSHTRKWRIPPSPPEVETFNVDKIPVILMFDRNGNEIGRIIENPRQPLTLEDELLEIVLRH
jgi:thiol-disulfide isomerase/thioredoxin